MRVGTHRRGVLVAVRKDRLGQPSLPMKKKNSASQRLKILGILGVLAVETSVFCPRPSTLVSSTASKCLDLDRGSDQLIWACRRKRQPSQNPFIAANRQRRVEGRRSRVESQNRWGERPREPQLRNPNSEIRTSLLPPISPSAKTAALRLRRDDESPRDQSRRNLDPRRSTLDLAQTGLSRRCTQSVVVPRKQFGTSGRHRRQISRRPLRRHLRRPALLSSPTAASPVTPAKW